jgi:deoxyribose-phosphate aldolase
VVLKVISERLAHALSLNATGVAALIESTLLDPFAGVDRFRDVVVEASRWGFRCVVVPVSTLASIHRLALDHGVRLCSVAGFPSGFQPLRSKVLEVEESCDFNVFEVDVVPNFIYVRSGLWDRVYEELSSIVDVAKSHGVNVKVIVEAPMLGDRELEALVDIAYRVGASFVKTSTGVYSKGGDPGTVHRLYTIASRRGLRVKAAGGIKSFLDLALAYAFGADTIGSSSATRIMEDYLRFKEVMVG